MTPVYASFWRRFGAFLIDAIVLGLIGWLIMLPFGTGLNGSPKAIPSLLQIILSIGYSVVYQHSAGQTLGKKALGIKVVDAQSQTPTLVTFFLREIIGKFVSAFILLIGFLMVIWDSKKQGLHDKIAGTYVIRMQGSNLPPPVADVKSQALNNVQPGPASSPVTVTTPV